MMWPACKIGAVTKVMGQAVFVGFFYVYMHNCYFWCVFLTVYKYDCRNINTHPMIKAFISAYMQLLHQFWLNRTSTISGLQAGIYVSALPVLHYLLVLWKMVVQWHREVWMYGGADGGSAGVFYDTTDTALCSISWPFSSHWYWRWTGKLRLQAQHAKVVYIIIATCSYMSKVVCKDSTLSDYKLPLYEYLYKVLRWHLYIVYSMYNHVVDAKKLVLCIL